MTRPISESILRTLFEIEFCFIVCRMRGRFYVHAPQLDIFDIGKTIDEALQGALEGVIGMLELMEERGRLPAYLKSRGFRKRQGVYHTSKDVRKQKLRDFVNDLEWEEDDVDKGRKLLLWAKLLKQELIHELTEPSPAVMWEHRYEEAPRAAATC